GRGAGTNRQGTRGRRQRGGYAGTFPLHPRRHPRGGGDRAAGALGARGSRRRPARLRRGRVMRFRPAGATAVLVELDDLDQVIGLHAALRRQPPAGTVDLVPAARTVLVIFDGSVTSADRVAADVAG